MPFGGKGQTISGASSSSSGSGAAVSLLFTAGSRPTSGAIRDLSERTGEFSVSFDPLPGNPDSSHGVSHWLEILASGLTYDLVGLAPGPPAESPPRSRGLASEDWVDAAEAVALRPGPHLASGAGMVPVVRMLASLAAELSGLKGVVAVAWHPARCWSAPEVFRENVGRWIEGGVFPGLTLASVALSPDRGLHSEGLALFTGQELRLEPEIVEDRTEAVKLAVRLLDFLVEHGRVHASQTVVGPGGMALRIEPSENGRFVRVCRG